MHTSLINIIMFLFQFSLNMPTFGNNGSQLLEILFEFIIDVSMILLLLS